MAQVIEIMTKSGAEMMLRGKFGGADTRTMGAIQQSVES